ncbi:hypothetical protein A3H19_00445 [Candidatus Woesebacteria bacterium RIFCSPLOWO2_12_FULL_39_9]|nr:MAG: hypothetical protein A3H19_00445 [Candidatus Woesebacteria bacterium RIFCSPLOWO2_12_FULL_39_9]
MKVRYDKEDDVMMIWLSQKKAKVDYAEQSKDIIIHFSKDNKPVLLEILNAKEFLKDTTNKLPSKVKKQLPLSA